MITLQALCFGILGYLLGATPYGLIIARVFCHTDPRTGGSHNTGATNVARMCGFGWGVATLAWGGGGRRRAPPAARPANPRTT